MRRNCEHGAKQLTKLIQPKSVVTLEFTLAGNLRCVFSSALPYSIIYTDAAKGYV